MQTESRSNDFRLTLKYVLVLAVLVALYKVLPRYLTESNVAWNLVPMGALAFFVGSRLRTRWACLIPFLAMLVADLLIVPAMARLGYPSMDASTPFTYLGLAVYFLIGRTIEPQSLSPLKIGGGALLGSILFFFISNFGSWVASTDYERSLAGLLTCYEMGIPFYRNTMLSDLVFPVVFFGLHTVLVHGFAPTPVEESIP